MLDSLHHALHDHLIMVCFVTIPLGFYSAYRCFHALTSTGDDATSSGLRSTRRMPSRASAQSLKSAGKPVQQQFISDKPAAIRVDSDDARHSTKGDAAIRKPTDQDAKPTVADEVGQLFAGLDDKLQPREKLTPAERTADAMAKAGRLEEIGFHHLIKHDEGTVRPVTNNPSRPTEAAKGPELDDILAKLDKVLAEQPAAANATTANLTPTTMPIVKTPLWARADATDEDSEAKPEPGKQLGLFEEGKDKPAP